MSRSAARAFMVGRGVVDSVGVASGVWVGAGPVGLRIGGDDVLAALGEEPAADGPGGSGEQPAARTRESAAWESAHGARPINRPYVARKHALTRASERPSGSQDTPPRRIGPTARTAIVTACALQEAFSSYVSVSAEHKLDSDTLPRLPAGSGGFLLARSCGVQA
jgi:hypothetical protein